MFSPYVRGVVYKIDPFYELKLLDEAKIPIEEGLMFKP